MITEIFIENKRADISTDLSALLTFALDDLKEFSERTTTFSKTVVLPGTANNNRLFGHIFQVGQANNYNASLDNIETNYNAAKSADCIIFQNQMQTFKGQMRLMEIIIDKGRPEYEVLIFGELAGLNVALSSNKLEDLDFSAYNHTYNTTNIIASWDNTPGSGYYYPLIDYGNYSTLKADWDIRTFRPALYVREYIDKMFTAAGYRYSSDLFDTARFKGLIIPHNKKTLTSLETELLDVSDSSTRAYSGSDTYILFNTLTELGTFTANMTGSDAYSFTYNGTTAVIGDLTFNMSGTYYSELDDFEFVLYVNGAAIASRMLDPTNGTTPESFSINMDTTGLSLNTGDELKIVPVSWPSAGLWALSTDAVSLTYESTGGTQSVPIEPGDTVQINQTIPQNIRQVDFLVSIVKLFNLYVYEDRLDSRLIHFTPYVDFYTTNQNDAVDWSYKLNRDRPIRVKPMSELTAKKYTFKFKPDSDYFNELYKKRYNEGYGDYTFDSQFEFAEQEKSFELIFSATPLIGYSGQDKVYSTIFKRTGNSPSYTEENIDCNIRIMQTKKLTGLTAWKIKDGASDLATGLTDYGYAGHFDDPDSPSNDLNFGALKELFFVLTSGDLSKTQFNLYWSTYCAEITNKDSKLVSAYFYLTSKDIATLDFQKKVYIDGILYKLSKIEDYNVSSATDCKVNLLKINYLLY